MMSTNQRDKLLVPDEMVRPIEIKEYRKGSDLVNYSAYLLGVIKKMNIDRYSIVKVLDDFNKDT